MKKLALIILLFALALPVVSQTSSSTAKKIRRLASEPATCAQGDIYFNTVNNKLRICGPANTFSDASAGSSSGTVTSVSVVTANGVSGSVATATTTPAITLTVAAASDTASGIVELATAAETTTGSDAARAVTPDGLAGSTIFGTKTVELLVFDFTTDTATGDGKFYFRVPASLNGMNLVGVSANVITAGTTGTTNIDLARCVAAATGNVCSSTVADMLSTNLTIDSGENDSATAAAAAVIDTSNDDVATGQVIRVDVDAVNTTAAKGLIVQLTFQLP